MTTPVPPFRFAAEVPLRWVDIDSWNVLNNAVYLTLMEQARYEYFAALDLLRDGQDIGPIGGLTLEE